MRKIKIIAMALLIASVCVPDAVAGKKKKATTPEVMLTNTGRRIKERYAARLAKLQAEIGESLPKMDAERKTAFLDALRAEFAAEKGMKTAKDRMKKLKAAKGRVAHAKGDWIGEADKGIAQAKAKLKDAETAAAREAAQQDLEKWQANREAGVEALKERQLAFDKAERDRPVIEQAVKEAKEALVKAKSVTITAVENLRPSAFLSSSRLDAKLAQCHILTTATPRGLAEYAQQGKAQSSLIEKLFSDDQLMVQMAVADGAMDGKYGRAMEILTAIQHADKMPKNGVLQRLAVAISLEHAVPIDQRNAKALTDAPATVDPVKRYLHFKQAYLQGELDPCFKKLTTWELRMVVNGYEPDEILTWGREMLRNYRPDHISTRNYRWRYVALVRSDVKYGSECNKYDQDELQFFQNILMNGGVCGRRAFIGRFILRAFGIPTTARPQRGHASLAHWTPDGWVICLGGGWGNGWVFGRKSDLDFLEQTQARAAGEAFMQVKRAQWIGDTMGEPRVFGLRSGNPGFWYGISFLTQRAVAEQSKAITLAAVGEDIGEANETKEKVEIVKVALDKEDRKISVDRNGVITIPAAATSKPTKSTGKIIFMSSNLGGKQLHYSRNGKPQDFEYTFDAPRAGTYALTARVVTPSWKQNLQVSVNGTGEPMEIALPFTVGMWDETEPLNVALVKGRNVLSFARNGPVKGVSIRNFTLTPIE